MRQQILAIAFTAMVSSIGMASAEIYRSSRSACGGAECACRKERDAGEGLEGANRMVESEPRWRFAGNRWDRQSTSPSAAAISEGDRQLFFICYVSRLLGGHIDLMFVSPDVSLPQVRAGNCRRQKSPSGGRCSRPQTSTRSEAALLSKRHSPGDVGPGVKSRVSQSG
jgi:hypothetical protein